MMGELGPQELTIRCDNPACGYSETRMHGFPEPAAGKAQPASVIDPLAVPD